MSLELLNTLATITTTLVIAATAIAAIVQLRHLRASNQIAGQLALRQVLLDTAFWDAMGRVRFEIPTLLKDPEFRKFVREFHLSSAQASEERFDVPYADALTVGRNLENIGNMIRNGLTDKRIFLEQYANLVVMAWDGLEPLVKIRRDAVESDAPWEDFEYLTVLSRQWISEVRSAYPKGVARILPSVGKKTAPAGLTGK
ncbi:MAG TPA: hypothetical protein VN934_10020 [Candidatus Tumulicola sp.]|nr:hypothetical protein [Candidatus Tumulicola sp.]